MSAGSGVSVAEYTYNAWGELLTATGTMSATLGALNPLRYRGYVYDAETGFYYLQSRYYDPGICRFINADEYPSTGQDFIGTNMFAYCNNNPVNSSDPTGEFGWAAVIASTVIGAASAAINAAIKGEEITVGTVLKGAAVGFVSGLTSIINPANNIQRAIVAGASAVISYGGARASGASVGEAIISGLASGITSYASSKMAQVSMSNVTSTANDVAEGVITFITGGSVESFASMVTGLSYRKAATQ